MAALTSTVTILTTDLSSANDKFVKALARITVLEKELATKGERTGTGSPPKTFSKTHYCSTHGPKSGHPSDTCKKPGPDHNNSAPISNRLGGREEPWPVWTPRS